MTVELRSFWQIGVVVADLDAAIAELSRTLGLEFPPPKEIQLGPHRLRLSIARPGPPYFELVEGDPGGPWDGSVGSRLDHVAYWVDDLAAERARLEAEGWPVLVDGKVLGMWGNYHLLPVTNIRVEPIASEAKEFLRERWELGDLDGGWNPRSPWQLGFMVDDIEAARDELTRALGVEWAPVKAGSDGDARICLSRHGPPYLELVQAGARSVYAWRPSPKLDHLAYWADDLEAESERLAAAGAPLVQEVGGAARFHHGPKSGIRLEVIDGAVRDTVREAWDLDDVG